VGGLTGVIIIFVLAVWLIALTVFLVVLKRHYDGLIKGVTPESLTSVLDRILGDLKYAKKDIASLSELCARIDEDGQKHIQKIGLLRFNPFKDTGGDQSFIISLVDSYNTGVVISGLYSRSGTRWYAKQVIDGKGVEHELSDEETRAIHLAKKIEKSHEKQ